MKVSASESYKLTGSGLNRCKHDIAAFADSIGMKDVRNCDIQYVAAHTGEDSVRLIEYSRDVLTSLQLSDTHTDFFGLRFTESPAGDFEKDLLEESVKSLGGLLKYGSSLMYVSPSVFDMLCSRAGCTFKAGPPTIFRAWAVLDGLYADPEGKSRIIYRRVSIPTGKGYRDAVKVFNVCSPQYKIHDPVLLYKAAEALAFDKGSSAVTYEIGSDTVAIHVAFPETIREKFHPGIELVTSINGESGTLVRTTMEKEGGKDSVIVSQASFAHNKGITLEDLLSCARTLLAESIWDKARGAEKGALIPLDDFSKCMVVSAVKRAIGQPRSREYLDILSISSEGADPIGGAVGIANKYAGAVAPSHRDRVRMAAGKLLETTLFYYG